MQPFFTSTPGRYTGPVPIVTHVHCSADVGDESDGYAEAWYLPAASDIPADYATLIKIIAGVLPPDSGTIMLEGRPVTHLGSRETTAHGIQVIY